MTKQQAADGRLLRRPIGRLARQQRSPMASRLNKLLKLLESECAAAAGAMDSMHLTAWLANPHLLAGSNEANRKAASQQICEVAKAHPSQLVSITRKVRCCCRRRCCRIERRIAAQQQPLQQLLVAEADTTTTPCCCVGARTAVPRQLGRARDGGRHPGRPGSRLPTPQRAGPGRSSSSSSRRARWRAAAAVGSRHAHRPAVV